MKISQIIKHPFLIMFIPIIVFCLCCWDQKQINLDKIKLYIYEQTQEKLDHEFFIKQKPFLILNEQDILKVKLLQMRKSLFTLEIELSNQTGRELEKITSKNIGKKFVCISNRQILFDPIIYEAIKSPKIVIDLAVEEEKAKEIARNFSNSVEVIDKQPFEELKLGPDFRKAMHLREEGKHHAAIKMLEQLIKQQKDQNKRIFLYGLIANTYRIKKDSANAAKTYRNLLQEEDNVDIDPNNYRTIETAYFYLSQIEKKQQDTNLSEYYFNKSIETLEFIIENFPTTNSAELANATIGGYELYKRNVAEAQKRAMMAINGKFKREGYVLLGLCYEYLGEFEKAKKEYKHIIKEFPDSIVSLQAEEAIKNLENKKTNIDKFFTDLQVE